MRIDEMCEMDCKTCANSVVLPSGVHKTVNGSVIITNGKSYTCTNKSVRNVSIIGDRMYCSDYKKKE